MKIFQSIIFLTLLAAFAAGCVNNDEQIQDIINEVQKEYAPDKRVALWNVTVENGVISGETNLFPAYTALREKLKESNLTAEVEINLLPDESLNGYKYALVRNSVSNIRSEPRHSAELSTQAIMGTPLNVLKKQREWYLVQTPDRYLSWVDHGGITLLTEDELQNWIKAEKVIFNGITGFVYANTRYNEVISDLATGNILQKLSEQTNSFYVALPDGRKGYIKKSEAISLEEWIANLQPDPQKLIFTAKSMMGTPYLWGGTSSKGVDCSGFTKTIYYMNGQIIPRDASQQVHEGQLVDDSKNWEKLQEGDLLFFGTPATESSGERVVHVGMWIGDNKFIHASGRVRISSVDPASPLYDDFNVNRYLRTKRILETPSENVIPVAKVVMW